MKRILTLIALAGATLTAAAQNETQEAIAAAAAAMANVPQDEVKAPKPNYWTESLMTNINFIQTSYSNWALGGNNNIALDAYIDANANYVKDKLSWKNRLQLDYGITYSADKPIIQKSKDRMLLESTYGLKATKTLSYSAKFTFLNQFTNGYTYGTPAKEDPTREDWKNERVLKSGFFSPAIATLGLGIDWVPNNWLTVNFAPLTGGFTIVSEKELGLHGENLRKNYGMAVKDKYENEPDKDLHPEYFRGSRFEFGAQLTADAKVKINDNFEAGTHLILFSNYLHNPQNVRINWDNRMMWKLTKLFALTLTTNLIYDDTVLITSEEHPQGRRMVQFMEGVKFGFTYTFASKK